MLVFGLDLEPQPLSERWVMMYIGVDLHKATAVVTALNESGQEVISTKYPNSRKGWAEFHKTFPDGGHVVLESVVNFMEVVDWSEPLRVDTELSFDI